MATTNKVTLIDLYTYLHYKSINLFEGLVLPTELNKQTLIDNILVKGGEFEVLYPDPEFCSFHIGLWSRKNNRTFEKWVSALNIDYSPLENYDRIEDWTDTNTGTIGNTGTTTSNSTTNTTNKISGFNSSTLTNDSSVDSTTGDTTTNSNTQTNNLSNVHTARIHGNIGVPTSQQMLQAELDISAWNIYEKMTDLFIDEFCIKVY